MTRPLGASEIERLTFLGLLRWIWASLSPFPPIGLRHTALPRSGMRAAARTLAFAEQDHLQVGGLGAGVRFVFDLAQG